VFYAAEDVSFGTFYSVIMITAPGLLDPEDEGTTSLSNVRNCNSSDTASHPTRFEFCGRITPTKAARICDHTEEVKLCSH
jgi:hypothetical protein